MEENIRKDWRETRVNIKTSQESLEDIMNGKRKSALDNLARRYLRFSNAAIIVMLCSPIAFFRVMSEEVGTQAALWIAIGFDFFMLVSSIMDRWLYHAIRRLDIPGMAVAEIARKAAFYRKRHLQFVAILLPLAIVWVIMVGVLCGDVYLIAGMVTGGIIGLAVGIRYLMEFLSDYRSLTE
ncbi:MAG: hypothetical protein J5995_06450 [Muribaculaceae bacterium]|nr:hypothetical protein [Muribaculaceae bacterium]